MISSHQIFKKASHPQNLGERSSLIFSISRCFNGPMTRLYPVLSDGKCPVVTLRVNLIRQDIFL